jgi:hypothetical protein
MAPKEKTTLKNCQPEDLKFNQEWHLVSSNRIAWTGKPYARDEESITTANASAWYGTACYWRERSEIMEYALEETRKQRDRLFGELESLRIELEHIKALT